METKQITVPRIITNSYCVARPQYIFLYGHDVMDKGMFGHSNLAGKINGKPEHENAFPIPVMYKFCNSGARYFSDADKNCISYIELAISQIPVGKIIIPLRKLGLGCSRLSELAPKTFKHLWDKLDLIRYPNIRWDYNGIYGSDY